MPRKRRFSEEPFGPTIQRLMAEQDVTYRALADKTGLSAGYLNHLVHGNRPVPSDDVIDGAREALGVEPEHFREVRIRAHHRAARDDARPDRPALQAPALIRSVAASAADTPQRASRHERHPDVSSAHRTRFQLVPVDHRERLVPRQRSSKCARISFVFRLGVLVCPGAPRGRCRRLEVGPRDRSLTRRRRAGAPGVASAASSGPPRGVRHAPSHRRAVSRLRFRVRGARRRRAGRVGEAAGKPRRDQLPRLDDREPTSPRERSRARARRRRRRRDHLRHVGRHARVRRSVRLDDADHDLRLRPRGRHRSYAPTSRSPSSSRAGRPTPRPARGSRSRCRARRRPARRRSGT